MLQSLRDHIRRHISISDEECSEIDSYFKPLEFKKKQNLSIEGKVCTYNYFVAKGLLRMFFINDKGSEQTVQFALENWWISDYTSFTTQRPSEFYIQAVERSQIMAISHNSEEALLSNHPKLERYFRLMHQRVHAATQYRMKNMYDMSREELYHDFAARFPEFIQRVPQYLLASYLGFTPEYLSEIRAKRKS